MAGPTAMAQEVHVELQLGPARGDLQHGVVDRVGRPLARKQAQPGADAADMGVDGHVAHPEREQQHAGRRLAPDAGQRREQRAGLRDPHLGKVVERRLAVRGRRQLAQDLLDARGLRRRQAARADRRLDLVERSVAHGDPVREAVAQPQIRDVPVAVVRRLREDGQDELGDRVAVRTQARNAVGRRQPATDGAGGSRSGHRADAIVAAPMPTAQFGDQLVNWHSEGDAPILYLHGVPNSSTMWAPFLKVSGGVAPDLPGFGLSGKRGDTDYSFEALGRFVGEFADHLGMERVRLCMHDWGAVGLLWAMRAPERVERLVLIDAVPFLPGYRWHFVARQWRKRFVGEVAMGATTRAVTRRLLPEGMV